MNGDSESQSIRKSVYDPELIRSLYKAGKISKDVFDRNISECERLDSRKKKVVSDLDSGNYPFTVSEEELSGDLSEGFITEDQHRYFSWFLKIRDTVPDEQDMISLKLKFSVWGLRLLGRYDTFEFKIERDSCDMVQRSYSVHGTLFEGCGNYKAPDAAKHTSLGKERTELIFRYLGILRSSEIMGKDYSEPLFDCGFYDMYVRSEDSPTVHTKGTTEYPEFLRLLLYLMQAESEELGL